MNRTILLISPYWKEDHRWMVSSVKLADLWQKLGYKVVVACMGSETRTETVSPTLTIHRRKDVFLPDPWNYGISFGFSGFVRRLEKEVKPDIIIVNKLLFWSSLSGIALALRGKRVLVLTDALVGMTWWPRGRLPRVGARIYAWTLGWWLLKGAERIVFFHPQPDRLLRRLGIDEKSQVIPTGIEVEKYGSRAENDVNNTIRKVNLTYVGRLESVKGVDDFLAAAMMVKKERPVLDVQVAGWYKDGHPLVEEYRRDVAFLGLCDDIPGLLGKTDIFVLPSYSEGLSNALMEAMSSGCACIASEVGGNAFLIQNGVSGMLFPPGDREALAAHIRRLIDDDAKRRNLGMAARARMQESFDWPVVGKKYQALFDAYLQQ